ncbi:MAG: selenocysteine-specific translation elongation factor [Bacillota bacterium]
MDSIVVGTAGHVDHGKTVLVKRLTGVETDRLKEEKERGISIELGFAPLKLSSGRQLGLVDVPGHERFIRHMLAGVAGIDLVMLVIAADEGVMPQTREHLDIIDLLQVKKGIIVITKSDLVDKDWLELVMEEVREAVQGSVLADAPLVTVSSVTGEGIPALLEVLDQVAAETPLRTGGGKVRLPVDRVFTITGFGTVVTGTLWSGKINTGDNLQLLPEDINVRVRNLQVHSNQVNAATAGERVAVNLAGIETENIQRGSVLMTPGYLTPSQKLDLHLHLLPSAGKPLKHHSRVRFHLGTSETFGRIVLLDREELAPGETSFAQIMMEAPVVAARQDHYVIRSYSPTHTIGGGVVVDPLPPKHKRYQPHEIEALETRLHGSPEELVLQLLEGKQIISDKSDLAKQTGLGQPELEEALKSLLGEKQIIAFSYDNDTYLLSTSNYKYFLEQVLDVVGGYHSQYPLRPGMPKEELRSRKFPAFNGKLFNGLLQAWELDGKIITQGTYVAVPGFESQPEEKLRYQLEEAENMFKNTGFQPPAWSEIKEKYHWTEEVAEELQRYLLRREVLVKVGDDLLFHSEAVEKAKAIITNHLSSTANIQLGEVRDLLNSSRKYILPLLEYFDQIKFTKRVGDKRILF